MQTKTLQKLARLLDKRLPKCFVSDLIRKVSTEIPVNVSPGTSTYRHTNFNTVRSFFRKV